MTTTLYQFRDADGCLLYVGISGDGLRRIQQHAAKSWWPQVATISISHYADRGSALQVEARTIRALSPKFNVHHGAARRPVAVDDLDRWLCKTDGCIRATGHQGPHLNSRAAA